MCFTTLTASLVCLIFPPCKFKNFLLRILGWNVEKGCRLGFSLIYSLDVRLAMNSRVGFGNIVFNDKCILRKGSYIGHLNLIRGPLCIILLDKAGIGNRNKIIRAKKGVVWGRSIFKLGVWSKITSEHVIDCTRSVILGDYTTLAGCRSQVWTHGYIHAPQGLERFRVDGSIRIGNNVYIGSSSVINSGVKINDGITVGSSTCVARSLLKQGMYVSQPLRYIQYDYNELYNRHPEVKVDNLIERVVSKKI